MILRTSQVSDQQGPGKFSKTLCTGTQCQALDTLAERTQVQGQTRLVEVVIRPAETGNIMES